ncbi:hypothetical protein B0H13DRAFT_1852547 [Mycena leptocephala]|nr:hypothetical protein B0H13DRAFT_1852547 [Mycena leptocephala]
MPYWIPCISLRESKKIDKQLAPAGIKVLTVLVDMLIRLDTSEIPRFVHGENGIDGAFNGRNLYGFLDPLHRELGNVGLHGSANGISSALLALLVHAILLILVPAPTKHLLPVPIWSVKIDGARQAEVVNRKAKPSWDGVTAKQTEVPEHPRVLEYAHKSTASTTEGGEHDGEEGQIAGFRPSTPFAKPQANVAATSAFSQRHEPTFGSKDGEMVSAGSETHRAANAEVSILGPQRIETSYFDSTFLFNTYKSSCRLKSISSRLKHQARCLKSKSVASSSKSIASSFKSDSSFKTTSFNALGTIQYPVYIEDSGPRFWDSLDADLRKIRNRASGNAHKLNNIPSDIVDEVQHEVDDTISAAAANKAATIPAAATEMGTLTRTSTSAQ